jgi:hypothetical protein
MRTISDHTQSAFRFTTWSIAAVAIVGLLLVQLGHAFSESVIRTGTAFLNHRVLPYHRLSDFELLLLNSGMYLCRLTVSLLIGGIIAVACKRREMLATIIVSLVCSIQAITGFWTFLRGWHDDSLRRSVLPIGLLYWFGGLFAMVIGGAIVRRYRIRSLLPANSI